MPPGTGDAQLSLVQAAHVHGGVIVTTPQQVAVGDALRGVRNGMGDLYRVDASKLP